jgi:hypothetical protein
MHDVDAMLVVVVRSQTKCHEIHAALNYVHCSPTLTEVFHASQQPSRNTTHTKASRQLGYLAHCRV